MSQVLLAKVEIPVLDPNLDNITNGFTFLSETATDYTGVMAIFNALQAFYLNAGTGGINPIRHYLGPSIDQGSNHSLMTLYDVTAHLNGSAHGSPVAVNDWTLSGSLSSGPMPEGVAAVLSWRASYGTDVEFGPGARPRARDRNRVYLGPLGVNAFDVESTTNRTQFTAQFIADCNAALFNLSESLGSDAYVLQVWSRKNASTKLPVESWMDDRPDYQRRRTDPTPGTRTYFNLSAP